jgi:hypothetical protein
MIDRSNVVDRERERGDGRRPRTRTHRSRRAEERLSIARDGIADHGEARRAAAVVGRGYDHDAVVRPPPRK